MKHCNAYNRNAMIIRECYEQEQGDELDNSGGTERFRETHSRLSVNQKSV